MVRNRWSPCETGIILCRSTRRSLIYFPRRDARYRVRVTRSRVIYRRKQDILQRYYIIRSLRRTSPGINVIGSNTLSVLSQDVGQKCKDAVYPSGRRRSLFAALTYYFPQFFMYIRNSNETHLRDVHNTYTTQYVRYNHTRRSNHLIIRLGTRFVLCCIAVGNGLGPCPAQSDFPVPRIRSIYACTAYTQCVYVHVRTLQRVSCRKAHFSTLYNTVPITFGVSELNFT